MSKYGWARCDCGHMFWTLAEIIATGQAKCGCGSTARQASRVEAAIFENTPAGRKALRRQRAFAREVQRYKMVSVSDGKVPLPRRHGEPSL